jgi:hypothetical protein
MKLESCTRDSIIIKKKKGSSFLTENGWIVYLQLLQKQISDSTTWIRCNVVPISYIKDKYKTAYMRNNYTVIYLIYTYTVIYIIYSTESLKDKISQVTFSKFLKSTNPYTNTL